MNVRSLADALRRTVPSVFILMRLIPGSFKYLPVFLASLSGVAVMLVTTGCSEASYRAWMKERNGPRQPGEVIFLPFILIEEAYLLSLRTDKENAAEAWANELSSRERRFGELQGLVLRGDKALQYELAFCYLHGRGTTHNATQAAIWYRKSAEQGFAEAQNQLGLCYFNEIGVRLDKIEACAWWTVAAPTHAQAKANLLFAEADAGGRMTAQAFAEFSTSVRHRAEEIRPR